MQSSRTYLRRYTDLPATLDLLEHKRLTLLPPSSWDDRSDRVFLHEYQQAKSLLTVLALCFTQAPETYHHWRVFSSGSAGVCIEFDREALLQSVDLLGLSSAEVQYLRLSELKSRRNKFELDELPFLKRPAYRDEQEFRMLFTSSAETAAVKHLPIPLSCIIGVVTSPWMPAALHDSVAQAIRRVPNCSKLHVSASRLIDGLAWNGVAKQIVKTAQTNSSR